VSRYGQYCPITRSLEMLGDRWTLLVVRDLLVGARRFNELARGLPGMSRGLLSKRLDQLERDGLVERADGAYWPTPACEELRPLIFGLAEWGARWAFGEPRADELDPTVLMWWIRGGIDPDRLLDAGPTGGRAVLHVRVPDARRSRFWFVATPGDVSLCFTDPGFEVDVTVESSLGVLYQVWLGALGLPAAVRDGLVTLTGRREAVRRLPGALRLSPAAPYVQKVGSQAASGATAAASVTR
jgi:DNA-binding HxlR family transcriptional regulator